LECKQRVLSWGESFLIALGNKIKELQNWIEKVSLLGMVFP
jgi:hypothetical protein